MKSLKKEIHEVLHIFFCHETICVLILLMITKRSSEYSGFAIKIKSDKCMLLIRNVFFLELNFLFQT